MDNVTINVFERGKLIETRGGHNIWLDAGRNYLSRVMCANAFSPSVIPEHNYRLRYMAVGIGGTAQSVPSVADTPPMSVSYPVGADPQATDGHQYKDDYPYDPLITTLERPVRISGSADPYPGQPTDVWVLDAPSLYCTHITLYEVSIHGVIDGTAGDVAYGTFLEVPLSEAGLMINLPVVSKHRAYNPIVAYFTFDTILLNSLRRLEILWRVRFSP